MKPRQIVALVIGSLFALVGFALFLAGGALGLVYGTQRDDSGFLNTSTHRFSSSSRAITSEKLDLHLDSGVGDWSLFNDDLATVRLRVTSRNDRGIFVGIGPERDVDRYLLGVAHHEVDDIDTGPFRVRYLPRLGEAVPADPAAQTFWEARAVGTGTQQMSWDVKSGRWAVVVMNADGSPRVDVDVKLGVKISVLAAIALGLLGAGLVALVVGVVLIAAGARGREKASEQVHEGAAPTVPAFIDLTGAGTFPARLDAEVDPTLRRWMWLVKWLLVIPHIVVLAFLWIAFSVLTFLAGAAILFTGRYPRGIFDFNVGVMRWSWRVFAYASNPISTDRYPPFTLDQADYPARLEVDYPASLSRGRVLVKWWLLAIPHYLIIGVFTSSWYLPGGGGNSTWRAGGSLLTILVFIAMIGLLFTNRYPSGLFNLIMGLNRWVFRVLVYAALMTDTYPPFRLDSGGADPDTRRGPPPESGPATEAASGPATEPELIDAG